MEKDLSVQEMCGWDNSARPGQGRNKARCVKVMAKAKNTKVNFSGKYQS